MVFVYFLSKKINFFYLNKFNFRLKRFFSFAREIRKNYINLKIGDERAPITLNYTSGTTDNLKRLVIHHCGAYLNSLGNVFNLGFKRLTKYLWTPPMLHCNEWYHTWAITAAGGTHFCLDQANPALIVKALQEQEITHFSYAPLNVAG